MKKFNLSLGAGGFFGFLSVAFAAYATHVLKLSLPEASFTFLDKAISLQQIYAVVLVLLGLGEMGLSEVRVIADKSLGSLGSSGSLGSRGSRGSASGGGRDLDPDLELRFQALTARQNRLARIILSIRLASGCFIAGILLFCFGIYAATLIPYRPLIHVVPWGGFAFMAGWLVFLVMAFSRGKTTNQKTRT